MKQPTLPGMKKSTLRRVETFDEAEVVVIPYGDMSNRRWFTLRDDRPIEVAHDDEKTVHGYQGEMPRLRARMIEKGVKTYMLLHQHRCEHKGCRTLSTTKCCIPHSDPKDDVVFCMMTGMPHNMLGKIEGEAVYEVEGGVDHAEGG